MKRCISAFSGRSTEYSQTYSFDDVYEKLSENGSSPVLIIFSSDTDDFDTYTGLFAKRFPESQVIGSTSFFMCAGNEGGKKGLSALAVYDGIECAGGVLAEAGRCPIMHISEARGAISKLGITEADAGRVICAEFVTAFCGGEEFVLDTLREASGSLNIPVVGSTAGVRRGTERSFVSLNGRIYTDACVFMYIRNLNGRINVLRENTYKHTEHFFQATSVDCDRHIIYEFNGRPAALYLASLLGIEPSVLSRDLIIHPIGRIYGDRIYIADLGGIGENGSLFSYSHIYNYSRAVLLEPDDVNTVYTRFGRKISELGYSPSFSLAVNCTFDYDVFEGKDFTMDIVEKLSSDLGCYAGMSGCGEQTGYLHLNKTMLLAAFE